MAAGTLTIDRRVVLATAVVMAAIVLVTVLRPNDERLIRKRLNAFAGKTTKVSRESPIAAAATARALSLYFTPDAEMRAGSPAPPLSGRQSIAGIFMQLRGMVQDGNCDFSDIVVTLEGDRVADVRLTATVKGSDKTGERFREIREFHIRMAKPEKHWQIKRLERVKTLQ